jgi:hypothetical protein
LAYFEKEDDKKLKGSIQIHNAEIRTSGDRIMVIYYADRNFELKAKLQ